MGSRHGRDIVGRETRGRAALLFARLSGMIKGDKLYGHTGYSMGIFSCIAYNSEKKYGFVILCDGADINYPDAFRLIHTPIIKVLYNICLKNR